ncbi:hypothetical protein AAFC00_004996 [Neodothiora populina]|uniref:Actin polymerization protein Bzz1 n=1 Tax=Neodothiora populina TaxID=2781224 RepID=A0ABR3P461_9PEZI
MAEMDIVPQFGAELKDGFKPVNSWVSNGIAWLDDMQSFYRERSAIEKEYSQKLSALAKKYFEKKIRKSSTLSVGDTPTVTPGSLESASMTTWTVQLTTLENRAEQHDRFAAQLVQSLADPIKNLANRYEDLRKHHADYNTKLEKERDGSYNDLKKTKAKYDGVCQEVENKRKKIESSFDHGKNKAQASYQQQLSDMRNIKNTYLIAINVTNKQKERYYHEYVPDLLDSLQSLSETRVAKLNSFWLTAASLETQTLTQSTDLLNHLSSEIPRNNPVLDSMMFVRHNASDWQDPPDFQFEPSPVWLDDDTMAVDESSKTFLRNIILKSKSDLNHLRQEVEAKRREVEGAKRVRQAIREGKDKRDEVEVVRAQFNLQEIMHEAERKKITAEVEVSTIASVVGDLSIGAQNHAFKSQTFKIPTSCDLCGERIWGLSAKGFECTDCGFTCHNKCQMKVPADCPGGTDKEGRKKLKATRQAAAQAAPSTVATSNATGSTDSVNDLPRLDRSDTMGSMSTLSSGYAHSAQRSVSGATIPTTASTPGRSDTVKRNRVLAPPPEEYANGSSHSSSGEARGRMVYSFAGSGEGELSINEGDIVTIVEPDDGSGWAKVRSSTAGEGLVPSSYMEVLPAQSTSPSPFGDDPSHNSNNNNNNNHSDLAIRPQSTASASTVSLTGSMNSGGKKKGPAVAPKRGAKKIKYVEALYTYAAAGEGEASMDEGEKLVLIAPDAGDGWCEVERQGDKTRGVVPAGWVREV